MKSNLEFDIKDVPFQPNHLTVTVTGDQANPVFVLEWNPNTVPNYRIQCKLTHTQLAGIHAIVAKYLQKNGNS